MFTGGDRRRRRTRRAAIAVGLALAAAGAPAARATQQPLPVLPPGFAARQNYVVGADAVTEGDFNGDGRTDIATVSPSSKVSLLLQAPDGTLAPPRQLAVDTGYLAMVSLAAADLDGDGQTDLIVASSNGIDVMMQQSGSLLPARHITDYQTYQLKAADLNGDGRPDLVVDGYSTSGIQVLLNARGGQFGSPIVVSTGTWPYGAMQIADVTGDGIPDIVGHAVTAVEVRAGHGDGSFSPPVDYQVPWPEGGEQGLALGDFDGDGRTDVAVTNGRNNPGALVYVFHQTSVGAFGAPDPLPSLDVPAMLETADINNDGRLDLVTQHAGWDFAGVYLQQPDGTFAPEQLHYTGRIYTFASSGLALGDVNGDGLPDVVVGSAGGLVVLRSASRVQAWGYDVGHVGTPAATGTATPGPPMGLISVASVAAGGFHNLALIDDGTVWSWGLNNVGQLGDGSTTDRASPVRVSGLSGVKSVSAGAADSAAIRADGTVWTWGWNEYGQLGLGTTSMAQLTPAQVPGLTGVTAVSVGAADMLALTSDGSVWAWGLGIVGQLGNGSTASSTVPIKVLGVTNIVAVAAGNFHNLALTSDGHVWSWGYNDQGQLGIGSTAPFATSPTLTSITNASAIGAGAAHSVAVSLGTVFTWGLNNAGELGDGTTVNKSSPVSIGCCVSAIAVGWFHTVALTLGGATVGWGWNAVGQLGTGTTANALSPVLIPGLNPSSVSAGIAHTVAVTARGTP